MAAHAKLSPSAAERWMTCPGYVHIINTHNIVSRGGAAANRGTAIHKVCEMALEKEIECSSYVGTTVLGILIDDDMAKIGQTYVDFIKNAQGDKYHEQKVSIEHLIEDCWGTADTIICHNKKLVVADLKSGVRRVDARNNKQLLIYALGAHAKYDWMYDFEEITMVIVQPAIGHLDVWTISAEELLSFTDGIKAAKEQIVTCPDTFVMSEKACEWCPAKFVCPEHISIANEAAKADFESLDDTGLEYWLDRLKSLKQFVASIEEEAYAKLLEGVSLGSYRLGTPQRRRSWGDEKALMKYIAETGLQSSFLKETVISPAQADKIKLDPKLREELNAFIEYTEAKAPIVKQASASDDFK